MKFYRIDLKGMFMNRKYAYLSVSKKNDIKDNEKYIEEIHDVYICPYCGFRDERIFYPEKNYGIFNKDSVGDFSFGVTKYGSFALSAKAVNLIQKYNLKGIVDFKKYISIETTRKAPITSIDNDYYEAKIVYLPLIWEQVVDENYNPSDNYCIIEDNMGCEHCSSTKIYLRLNKTDIVYIKGLDDVTFDIFSTMDNRGEIFVSQNFVDMCIKENLTNIVNRFVEVFDSKLYEKNK